MQPLLVVTWNLFHGRTVPPSGEAHLEEMVGRIAAAATGVACLQELPVWALEHLERWSGMRSIPAVTMPALGGPLAARLTERAPYRLRSSLTGQANAVLVSPSLAIRETTAVPLNPRRFRRREAQRIRLPGGVRRAWGQNRRVAQVIRIGAGERSVVVVNAHLTRLSDSRPADAELERALASAAGFARPDEPLAFCGDLNLTPSSSAVLAGVAARGFSPPQPGVDQILVRGLRLVRAPTAWPEARRREGEFLLSDHSPVEAAMMWP
jgi:endonuclease/exonuclease/phosphatase family metal-dependent hydrolase